jgi:hypothetical protein
MGQLLTRQEKKAVVAEGDVKSNGNAGKTEVKAEESKKCASACKCDPCTCTPCTCSEDEPAKSDAKEDNKDEGELTEEMKKLELEPKSSVEVESKHQPGQVCTCNPCTCNPCNCGKSSEEHQDPPKGKEDEAKQSMPSEPKVEEAKVPESVEPTPESPEEQAVQPIDQQVEPIHEQ